MIETLVFSRDRACQLDLLLRSIKDNLPELEKISVLYKATNKNFKKGYEILLKKFPKIYFIEEENFCKDVKRIVNEFTEKNCLFLCDDAVMINEMEISNTLSILNGNVHGVSLRLNPNLPHTYMTDTKNVIPKFEKVNVAGTILYKWEWKKAKENTDYAYPSCIDGHVYQTGWITFIVDNAEFSTPNHLEVILDGNKQIMKPCLVCFEKTIMLTVPQNVVQNLFPNNRRNPNPEYSIENLNKRYLDGFVIDTENIYGIEPKAVHEEVEFKWIQNLK